MACPIRVFPTPKRWQGKDRFCMPPPTQPHSDCVCVCVCCLIFLIHFTYNFLYIFYYHPTNNCVFSLLVSCNCLSPSFIIFTSFMLKPPYQIWLNTSNFTWTNPNLYGFSWPQRGNGARMKHPWSDFALPHCHPYQISSSELLIDFVKWQILERLKNFEWIISGGKNLDLLYWLILQSWLNNNELLKKKSYLVHKKVSTFTRFGRSVW